MADSTTSLYGLVLPEVGASADSWGGKVNNDFSDLDGLLGAYTLTGSSNAYVLTTGMSLAAYAAGQRFCVKWNHTNSGSATLNVDGLGAKTIKKRDASTNCSASDLVSGTYAIVTYDGTNFVLLSVVASDFQALDATLTALAALSWSSGSPLIQFTAADTVSLTSGPTVSTIRTGAGTVSANAVQVNGAGQGFYSTGTNVAVAVGGALISFWQSTGYQSQVPILGSAGSASAPSIVPSSADTNSGFYAISSSDNIGLSLGGTLRADFSTTLFDFTVPTRARLARSAETSGTLTAASANKVLPISAGITINDGVFTADDVIIVYNNSASSITITQGTGMTLRLHGTTTTGNRTLVARGVASIYFLSNTEAIVSGDVT